MRLRSCARAHICTFRCVYRTYIFDCESRNRASRSRAPILLKYYCRLLEANFSEGHGTCILSPLHEQIERARSMRSSRRIVLSDGLPRYRDTRVLPLSTITESRSTRTSVLYRINRSYVFPRRFDLLFSTCRDSSFEIARIFGRVRFAACFRLDLFSSECDLKSNEFTLLFLDTIR